MMADKYDNIIGEIAMRHGVAVDRNDPILIMHTLNEMLQQENATAQQKILDRFKEEMEGIVSRWGDEAKSLAERSLNAALNASREEMKEVMHTQAEALAQAVRREVKEATARLAPAIRESKQVSYINLIATLMVSISAIVIMWTFMKH